MFPTNSAFSPDDNHVKRLFQSSEQAIKQQEDQREASVPLSQLENWYHTLDEIALNQVPAGHRVAGGALNRIADQAADLRDEIASYLRG